MEHTLSIPLCIKILDFARIVFKVARGVRFVSKMDVHRVTNKDPGKSSRCTDNLTTQCTFTVAKQEQISDESFPDLNQFKFERKPHVKIQFEKCLEEESSGIWEPPKWREFLVNLRNMRANNDAPVDSMGCHKTVDENASPEVLRYQTLIGLMLSSQTKDQVTFAAMERLRERGLNIENVLRMSDEELGQLIYPVGFWKTKVKYIKKTTQTLKEQYNGDIPDSVEKLCKLTGVGPKMAHLCMSIAWKRVTGIGVDTHVHRISNRIGWVKKVTTTPEDTRKALESWLPYELWDEVNHLMVGFGQTICQPVAPNCNECLNKDICPYTGKIKLSPMKKSPIKKTTSDKDMSSLENDLLLKSKSQLPREVKPLPKISLHHTDDSNENISQVINVNLSVNGFANKKITLKQKALKRNPIKIECVVHDQNNLTPLKKSPENKIKIEKISNNNKIGDLKNDKSDIGQIEEILRANKNKNIISPKRKNTQNSVSENTLEKIYKKKTPIKKTVNAKNKTILESSVEQNFTSNSILKRKGKPDYRTEDKAEVTNKTKISLKRKATPKISSEVNSLLQPPKLQESDSATNTDKVRKKKTAVKSKAREIMSQDIDNKNYIGSKTENKNIDKRPIPDNAVPERRLPRNKMSDGRTTTFNVNINITK